MENKKLLIIEDKKEEATAAREVAGKLGFYDITVAENLSDALRQIPYAQAVASDLFFPAGGADVTAHAQRFLKAYENYRTKNYTVTTANNPIFKAISKCAELFGVTPKEYVENFMTKMNNPEFVMREARKALTGISNPERYTRLQEIEADIREGRNLPLGIITTEAAMERGLPTVIVTSTNHHDLLFEPIRELVRVPYVDRTVSDGRKDWAGGLSKLIQGGNHGS